MLKTKPSTKKIMNTIILNFQAALFNLVHIKTVKDCQVGKSNINIYCASTMIDSKSLDSKVPSCDQLVMQIKGFCISVRDQTASSIFQLLETYSVS